jgi:hypothetical protein
MAMQAIAEEGRGLVIYEYQEGRGIGLMKKLEAYELQDFGLDTVEANHALGFKADLRDFSLPAAILRNLRIKRVRLLSNNPRKASALTQNGVELVAVLSCEAAPNPHSFTYLRTKKERMGHALSLGMAKARTGEEVCVRCDLVGWRTTCPVCVPFPCGNVSGSIRNGRWVDAQREPHSSGTKCRPAKQPEQVA